LETTFRAPSGSIARRDLMPVRSGEDKRACPQPDHEVLREVEGLAGEVDVEVLYEPRPDYGRARPEIARRGGLGLWCEVGRAALILQSELPLDVTGDGRAARGVARVHPGERRYLSLSYAEEAPAVV